MAKSKKKHKPNRNQQNRKAAEQVTRAEKDAPNNGRNRAEKRIQAQSAGSRPTSSKPTWLRILIIAVMAVMLLGLIIPPLMR